MNRRQFLKTTSAAAIGALATGCVSSSNSKTSPIGKPLGANDDIRVAVIGFHQQGKSHIKNYRSMPGVRLVALCDVDDQVLQSEAAELAKDNVRVKTYRDLRKLFDDKEIDAVSCATTNHWHSLTAIWACQAGKDVCVEKPISHSIWEGSKVVEAARKYNRMVQADLDYRSRTVMDEAFAYIQSGQLGKIVFARAWDYKRRESMGKITGPAKVPESIDYNLWTGPAPMLPLMREKLHYDWHWQWATGNGEIGNNGSHSLDQIRWALAKDHLPPKVMSFGGRFGYVDDGQTPNTIAAIYDFDGIPVIYEARGLPAKTGAKEMDDLVGETANGKPVRIPGVPGAHQGILIFCEGGYCHGGVIYDNDGKEIKKFNPADKGRGPQHNFINAVRTRKITDLKTDIHEGHLSASFCHMGNISIQCGDQVSFDAARKAVASNRHASKAMERMTQHLGANGVNSNAVRVTLGPVLSMDPKLQRFTGENAERANLFIKDSYRAPFVVPEQV
jgi:predicted dehydrogenase